MGRWRGISIPEKMAEELEALTMDEYIQATYGVSSIPEIVRRACTDLIKKWRDEIREAKD